ncbi:MAG: hypothetical protein RL716_1176 [Actinomycetota bacterium]
MPRERGQKVVASNRKARHDYLIIDVYEAGMSSLVDGYATIEGGEVWLENVHIPEYTQATWNNGPSRRRRKLLLHGHEIYKLMGKIKESGYTLVPLSIYFKDGRAKVEIALAKGKREYDKRQTLKERQDTLEASRAMSTKGKDW